jgi:hypothetical protein
MQHFIVFVLAVFVGFQVIWNVSHALHTPLMAITNAISSIIILGALMQIGSGSMAGDPACRRVGLHGRDQHLRRLPRHPAHARHVPEIVRGQGNGIGFTTAAYVVAAVLFILALGGLSGQESAKRAVWYGIVGMALAVFATLIGPGSGLWLLSLILIAGGGVIGWYVAKKVQMTEMPQLVAAMHSLVGLAAVFVGFNAYIEMVRVAGMDEASARGAHRLRRRDRAQDAGGAHHPARSSCSSASSSGR